ncbi:MAG: hypothetical protein KDK25_09265 [Leptospiraceae bacterium]|nr:hypothetical protein [Leptospiraceae bacterium]
MSCFAWTEGFFAFADDPEASAFFFEARFFTDGFLVDVLLFFATVLLPSKPASALIVP